MNLNGILTGEVCRVISKPCFTERLRHSDAGHYGLVASVVWASSDEGHAVQIKGSVRVSFNLGLISRNASPNKPTFIWGLLLILTQAEQPLAWARAVFDRGLNVLNNCKPSISTHFEPLPRGMAKDGIASAIASLCQYRLWFLVCGTEAKSRIVFFLTKIASYACLYRSQVIDTWNAYAQHL